MTHVTGQPEGDRWARPGWARPGWARLGALGIVAAMLVFGVTFVVALNTPGTAFVWSVNMISDLGDSGCRVRGGRWICSPGFAVFNTGLIIVGLLLAASAGALFRLWGRVLAGSVLVMGLGLIVAAVFPAGDAGAVHLVGVVLALVVPGLGLLLSAIRPETTWLGSGRVPRGVLAVVALVLSAENRLPTDLPQGAGQVIIVGCLVIALLVEATRTLGARSARSAAADDESISR